jgi:hypothetical protein
LDDAFRQQVQHLLAAVHRSVSGEEVVEGAVLADDDNDVLYRRRGVAVIGIAHRSRRGKRGKRRRAVDSYGANRYAAQQLAFTGLSRFH